MASLKSHRNKQQKQDQTQLWVEVIYIFLSTTTASLGRQGKRANTNSLGQAQPRACKLYTKQTSH